MTRTHDKALLEGMCAYFSLVDSLVSLPCFTGWLSMCTSDEIILRNGSLVGINTFNAVVVKCICQGFYTIAFSGKKVEN